MLIDLHCWKSDLSVIIDCANANGFFNASKPKAILVSSSLEGWAMFVPVLEVEGVKIAYSGSVRNLGLTLDDFLRAVPSEIFAGIRALWPSARFTPSLTALGEVFPVATHDLLLSGTRRTFCCS